MKIIKIHKDRTNIVPSDRRMELIIKPTEKCNFKCTFCSSTNITDDKNATLDLDRVFEFLTKYPRTSTIIVNGGDPLMVPVKYYIRLLEYIESHNLPTRLSITSNLWAFYKQPSKWLPILSHPRVGVGTSFNYGDTRKITETEVYTEDMFWKVSDLFLDAVGYRPDFISVISDDNEHMALDNVRLAKKMNVECKLNYAMASGAQTSPYQLSKIYKIYLEVYNEGLWEWEYNTKQMVKRLNGGANSCPQNRICDENIRCLQPSGDYYSCGSFADDRAFPISFDEEMANNPIHILQQQAELICLKDECLTCDMFTICNGCKKTVHDMKHHNMVEPHCKLMKSISRDIIIANEQMKNTTIDLSEKLER